MDAIIASDNSAAYSLKFGRKLFNIATLLLVIGFSTSFVSDISSSEQWKISNAILTIVILILCVFLTNLKVLSTGVGLTINLLEALRNVVCTMILIGLQDPHYPMVRELFMQTLLLTSLFASVLGLAVNKNAALIFCIGGILMQLLFIQLFHNNSYISDQFTLNSLIMTGNLLIIYYYRNLLEKVFRDLSITIKTMSELQQKAETLNEQNHPFVAFGKNTAGLVHDFRNDVNSIFISVQTMRIMHNRGKALNSQDIDSMERAIVNLSHRIDWVQYSTGALPERGAEAVDLRQLVESAVYPFTISPELRGRIQFDIDIGPDVVTWGKRLVYLQILENIIRNSCEALRDSAPPPPTVRTDSNLIGVVGVRLWREADNVYIELSDTGPGIPHCKTCKQDNCLHCSFFTVGKTTKSYGSGYGMVNIIHAIKELGGAMKIQSSDAGTKININIPHYKIM